MVFGRLRRPVARRDPGIFRALKVLLDTHAFVWWIDDDARLSETARELLAEGRNELLFSVASALEMAIKIGVGKLTGTGSLSSYLSAHLSENAIGVLPVSLRHAVGVSDLPNLHRDPFDRLLVARATAEDLLLLTADPLVPRYSIRTIW